MPLKAILFDLKTGRVLHSEDYFHEGLSERILSVTTIPRTYGVFKTIKTTTAGGTGSTTVAEPVGNGSIELTDLIISFEKKASAEVTIQFNDGSNTELIWFGDMQDAPLTLAIPFNGQWRGWKGAYLEVVIAGAGLDGSIGIGYIKYLEEESLSYNEWNSRR